MGLQDVAQTLNHLLSNVLELGIALTYQDMAQRIHSRAHLNQPCDRFNMQSIA